MIRWIRLAPVVLVAGAGCLASKGDIRLLQDEFRATRAQLGLVDTSIVRTNAQVRQELASLRSQADRQSAQIERFSDSLRTLAQRVDRFQGQMNGEVDVLQKQMVQMQELLGQNVKNLQQTRAQLEALERTGGAPPSTGATSAPAGPGPATLYTAGQEAFRSNAYATARRSFEELLATYPNDDYAPRAMLNIGDAYLAEGNLPAADSVFQRLPDRFPTTDEAPTAMFKRATKVLWPSQKTEARALLDKVVKDYPNATVRSLARDFLRDNR